MRWAVLYACSRGIPAAGAGVLAGAAAIWALGRTGDGVGIRLGALAAVLAAALLGPGLTGQDTELDRTAAIRWVPRRAGHVLLAGAAVAGLFAAWAVLDANLPREVLIRDTAGAAGLVALTAVLLGGRLSWTLPLTWFAMAVFVSPADTTVYRAAAWMLQPPGTPAATWTAVALAGAGTLAYAVAGNRR